MWYDWSDRHSLNRFNPNSVEFGLDRNYRIRLKSVKSKADQNLILLFGPGNFHNERFSTNAVPTHDT